MLLRSVSLFLCACAFGTCAHWYALGWATDIYWYLLVNKFDRFPDHRDEDIRNLEHVEGSNLLVIRIVD